MATCGQCGATIWLDGTSNAAEANSNIHHPDAGAIEALRNAC